MTANPNPVFELIPVGGPATFVNADGTGLKTLVTAGADGCRIDAISITSNSTAAENLAFWIQIGGTDYYIGVVLIPIGSGYTTVVKVDGLVPLKPAYQNFILLPPNALLRCSAVVAITAAKTVTVIAMGGSLS
jgi:hypothetical protein